jgi:hypothetical protein
MASVKPLAEITASLKVAIGNDKAAEGTLQWLPSVWDIIATADDTRLASDYIKSRAKMIAPAIAQATTSIISIIDGPNAGEFGAQIGLPFDSRNENAVTKSPLRLWLDAWSILQGKPEMDYHKWNLNEVIGLISLVLNRPVWRWRSHRSLPPENKVHGVTRDMTWPANLDEGTEIWKMLPGGCEESKDEYTYDKVIHIVVDDDHMNDIPLNHIGLLKIEVSSLSLASATIEMEKWTIPTIRTNDTDDAFNNNTGGSAEIAGTSGSGGNTDDTEKLYELPYDLTKVSSRVEGKWTVWDHPDSKEVIAVPNTELSTLLSAHLTAPPPSKRGSTRNQQGIPLQYTIGDQWKDGKKEKVKLIIVGIVLRNWVKSHAHHIPRFYVYNSQTKSIELLAATSFGSRLAIRIGRVSESIWNEIQSLSIPPIPFITAKEESEVKKNKGSHTGDRGGVAAATVVPSSSSPGKKSSTSTTVPHSKKQTRASAAVAAAVNLDSSDSSESDDANQGSDDDTPTPPSPKRPRRTAAAKIKSYAETKRTAAKTAAAAKAKVTAAKELEDERKRKSAAAPVPNGILYI